MSRDEPASTRHRILEAAWGAVEELGAGVRMGDVALRAGVSRQAVYLHFKDRAALLLALVDHMDETLEVDRLVGEVFAAPGGVAMLDRALALYAQLTPRIDRVARVLERSDDPAMAAAWRDRMSRRRSGHLAVIGLIAAEGRLADGWTVEEAADLLQTLTLPATWRTLTEELGWTSEQYREGLGRTLRSALLKP
ncbi:TetR/AcrR family transcriptional regulator [Naasia sp. SYSU D00948]|uniref:TetR/AcrR family transcriptional regulator n=1 Tax=Naasia sp. SYSU D00948 TaxID=2817379 RepID=UPI001B306505|nr:TetR/AcrR family transcriptional regulator [Naasia sp. SYSU D00948]